MNNKKSEIKNDNNDNIIILEKDTGHKPIPVNIIKNNINSICKIEQLNIDKKPIVGFFIKLNILKDYYFLITSYKFINEDYIKKKERLEIILNIGRYTIDLNEENRIIIYLNKKGITAIELLDEDELNDKINFLYCDLNYIDGYEQYKKKDIFVLHYPINININDNDNNIHADIGKISKINYYEFEYLLSVDECSPGSPIILVYNQRVIGVCREYNNQKNINIGNFIGELINEIKNMIEKEEIDEEDEKSEENNENEINDESNLFKYQLNGENKVAKITDSIFIKTNDVITFNVSDIIFK